ncbi:MAG: endonuclease/exonuclease/phosphatase family protein [Chitinophagaceae bacterium]|nr:endonuclease/exonuclease/phosphatase family protein [Chitinophagaceae bacterium]
MSSKFRLFTKRFFIIINIIVVAVFLLACLIPYLNPKTWWFISFLGLAFPFLLFIVLAFLIWWLIVLKPKLALISAVALLLGYKSITAFLAFHSPKTFNYKKQAGNLRVASWNVARFLELKRNNNEASMKRLNMFEQIKQQDADILCLQEFHTSTNPDYYDNITPIQKELGYPYFYFSFDEDGDRHYYSSITFSKFPIIDSGLVRYPRPTLPDVLLFTDIKYNKDTIRVYTTHLQSNLLDKKDYERLNKIKSGEDSIVSNSKNILAKLKRGSVNRGIQATIISDILGVSPYPFLLCADLNDIPNSYTYFTAKGNLQDAFLKKGAGIGRTFASISPTLRIDYIFTDKQFKIIQFNRIAKRLSDHYMLVADVELKSPNP